LIPISMVMYPGNESEKPYLRKTVETAKSRYNIEGRTIQVADKGLNCAKNIYAAVKEANDGYIFSKSVHGRNLSEKEKEWVLLENDVNVYQNYCDSEGNIRYRLKECVDDFTYSFDDVDPSTGEVTKKTFKVKEKRVVSYTPSLAVKQKAEIYKMVEKAKSGMSLKKIARDEYGDAAKYLSITTTDKDGHKIAPLFELNNEKIQEDLNLAGYNLMVTSEITMKKEDVYNTYHGLWKIEESFRITKSYLDARPVYLQKKETIYGHFLICYLCLFLLRVMEIKCFRNQVSAYDIIEFIRDFNVVDKGDGTFINISHNRKANSKIKNVTGLTNIDALILTREEIDKLFNSTMLIDSEL